MVVGWLELSFDVVDDPELLLSTARMSDQFFLMDGWLDWEQAHALNPVMMKNRPLKRREIRRYLGASGRRLKAPIRLVVPQAQRFQIRDRAGIGITVPERFEPQVDRVEIVGLMDCDITVWTPTPTITYFELGPLGLARCGLEIPRGAGGSADGDVRRGPPSAG